MSWEDLTGQRDTLTVGKDISELRTSVKGDPYVYVQNEVYFSHHMFTNMAHTVTHENIRCATIFKSNNGGINVGALYQRIVFINGKTYKPTRIVNLHRTPGGAWLRRSKGKWIKLDLFRSNYLVGMERLLSVAERVGEF